MYDKSETVEMKKHISDVFDIDKVVEEHGNKIFLIAGVGAGKSTWVKDTLTKKGNVLFVTSRKAKVEEDVSCSTFTEVFKMYANDNQLLITNAKLASIIRSISNDTLSDLDEFIDHFDYIVIDEVHSIATDSTFAEACFDVWTFIEYVANKGVPIVVMTGTPEPIQYYFEESGWYIVDYREVCEYVTPGKIRLILNRYVISTIEKEITEGKKIVYFVNKTETIADIYDELLKRSIVDCEEIALCVAKTRHEEVKEKVVEKIGKEYETIVEEKSEETYKSIIEKKALPDECKILLSTSALREGIDIENENITMICENHILSNLIQFFGRVRMGGGEVYIVEDVKEHSIKSNSMLYDYAEKKEVNSANEYLNESINILGNLLAEKERFYLLSYLKRNPYLWFDYIDKKFKVFSIKFHEECRLKNIRDWKSDLIDYCNKWNISTAGFMEEDIRKNIHEEALLRMAEKKKKFYIREKEIDILKNTLKIRYGVKMGGPKKINEELEAVGARVRIISKTEGHEKRTYWQVVLCE